MLKQQDWGADMGWMQKLCQIYEHYSDSENLQDGASLAPPFHIIQQAHLEIALDANGNFRRAQVIEKEYTIIPATEKSATARTSAVVPHPLCDYIKYCAADYKIDGEKSNKHFDGYIAQLKKWCESPYSHPKVTAVLRYVEKGTVIRDLIDENVLPIDADNRLLTRWESREDKPLIFKQLQKDQKTKEYKLQNALIRWLVESDQIPEVWKDQTVQHAWIHYCKAKEATLGFCMVTGENCALADKHPKGLRGGKDGAKLISYKKEDDSDFIYLGRMLKADQVVGIGLDVSQKAHSALRWLIERQGFRNGDQTIVSWAMSGNSLPDWINNSAQMFGLDAESDDVTPSYAGDAGQAFAIRLNKCIAGYRTQLGSTEEIVIMALDSATTGRMAITYYRELTSSEFLERLKEWHESSAWHQNLGQNLRFVGVSSPKEIAEAAYGRQLESKSGEKLRKATVERLLPCIIEGQPIPRDLLNSVVRRTCNRAGFKKDKRGGEWDWERNLGIACSLFKGHHKGRIYQMALEQDRTTRDYLFGRLLAVAERIEGKALHLAGESRDTSAAKYMQRFADRPSSTWRTIELDLVPYKKRLRSKASLFLREKEQLLDSIVCSFDSQDFISDERLSGEFLLGYHCQRLALWSDIKPIKSSKTTDNQTNESEKS